MGTKYSDLYSEYKTTIRSLTDDNDFYEELLDNVERGENQFSLFHRYFEKKIDLAWVDAIEACIIPLDNIVRNPRRFIVQEEEIVPIERARKITAESVRHLAQHTNLIARVDGDNVTPSQILNVFREESYEIYENRFIFTLIRMLIRFIDTRYDALFTLRDDENMASLKMISNVEKGGEKIQYKLEISSQSGTESTGRDTKEHDAFQRIGHIKQIINEFGRSAFMNELQHCTPVRPPIMRTNVIMKDPNFQACLRLWQFISSYDDVGYEIIAHESNEMVSEEYRNDLNRLYAFNYLLLKNNTVSFQETAAKLKKRRLKPKMLKRLAEELVMDYDMEEVEIRRVFVEELKRATKKKIKGEERIRNAIAGALAAEKARKDAIEEKIRQEIQRKKEIEKRRKERERAKIARQKELERQRKERERARLKAKKEKEAALAKAKRDKEREKARIQREKERLAKQKALEAERKAKAEERERIAREKAKQAEAEKKAKARERERIAREKAKQAEKEKQAKARQRERERIAREKAKQKEKERLAAEKQKERERIAREKAKQKEKERLAAEKQKERERIAREKAKQKEKERLAAEKQKERERVAREKAKQKEKERLAAEKQKERERIAREKAKQKEKVRLAAERQKERERQAAEKEKQVKKASAAAKTKTEAGAKTKKEVKTTSKVETLDAQEIADQKEKQRAAREKARQAKKERFAQELAELEARQKAEKEQLLASQAERLKNLNDTSDSSDSQ